MPTKPRIVTLTNSSVDILNAIRNYATTDYRNYVPVATSDPESIREIGAVIMDMPALQNEFLSALVNRIGRVVLTSKTYENPWAMFKQGFLEFGETVEEIFTNIAKPHTYDAKVAESEVFKREIPDVRSAFHIINYKHFYKATIEQEQLRNAFLSWQGITDLVSTIVDSLYTASNYDEFMTMKSMLAKHILSGLVNPATVPTVSSENMRAITSIIKGVSNDMTFMKTKYNLAGVKQTSKKENQYLLVDSRFDATMDVEVLATSFHMDKAEFMGHVVLVDSFGDIDNERLAELFDGDDTYVELTPEQLSSLNSIPAVLVDEKWFMVFDALNQFEEMRNGQGLYWNYYYHVWKTFSTSPFANNCVFVAGTPSVKSVTVSPASISVKKGQSASFSATVATEFFAPKAVTWTTNNAKVSISKSGVVTVADDATTGSVTVTATSVYDGSVNGTATITVTA